MPFGDWFILLMWVNAEAKIEKRGFQGSQPMPAVCLLCSEIEVECTIKFHKTQFSDNCCFYTGHLHFQCPIHCENVWLLNSLLFSVIMTFIQAFFF